MIRISKLSSLQKAFMVPYFGIGSLLDPKRADLVAGLGDATSDNALNKILHLFRHDPNGQILLTERPQITSSIFKAHKSFPPNSLGLHYFHFMEKHNFSSDDRSPVRFIEDPEKHYIMTRYRQIHDFWHVLSGLPPGTVLAYVLFR